MALSNSSLDCSTCLSFSAILGSEAISGSVIKPATDDTLQPSEAFRTMSRSARFASWALGPPASAISPILWAKPTPLASPIAQGKPPQVGDALDMVDVADAGARERTVLPIVEMPHLAREDEVAVVPALVDAAFHAYAV